MAKRRRIGKTRPKTRPKQARRKVASRGKGGKGWTQRVSQQSDALDLERGVFALNDPKEIAASLKRSAEKSTRRKAEPFRSALSMLTFYINRAGRNLPAARRKVLMRAKDELRRLFGRQ